MTLVLEEIDRQNIGNAMLQPGRLWDNQDLQYLKDKIRDYFINCSIPRCCYCYKSFVGQHRLDIDTEHILPQSFYKDLIFEPLNLNIACKRCNMTIKKERLDFITDISSMGTDYFKSQHYKFIHPNLDIYTDHISRKDINNGDFIFLKFIVRNKSSKGQFTYDFFEFRDLEIDNINIAQGINPIAKPVQYLNWQIQKIKTKF
jgi:hypothetical protein